MHLLDLNTEPCPQHDDGEVLALAVAAGNATLAREAWADRNPSTPSTTGAGS